MREGGADGGKPVQPDERLNGNSDGKACRWATECSGSKTVQPGQCENRPPLPRNMHPLLPCFQILLGNRIILSKAFELPRQRLGVKKLRSQLQRAQAQLNHVVLGWPWEQHIALQLYPNTQKHIAVWPCTMEDCNDMAENPKVKEL